MCAFTKTPQRRKQCSFLLFVINDTSSPPRGQTGTFTRQRHFYLENLQTWPPENNNRSNGSTAFPQDSKVSQFSQDTMTTELSFHTCLKVCIFPYITKTFKGNFSRTSFVVNVKWLPSILRNTSEVRILRFSLRGRERERERATRWPDMGRLQIFQTEYYVLL